MSEMTFTFQLSLTADNKTKMLALLKTLTQQWAESEIPTTFEGKTPIGNYSGSCQIKVDSAPSQ